MGDTDKFPAFPVIAGQQVYATGMTLRDWFAGQFLSGAATDNGPLERADGESIESARARYWAGVAAVAYSAANAMIAARSGK